jgi:hypothetical protein
MKNFSAFSLSFFMSKQGELFLYFSYEYDTFADYATLAGLGIVERHALTEK